MEVGPIMHLFKSVEFSIKKQGNLSVCKHYKDKTLD